MEYLLFGIIAGSAFILLFAKIGLKKIANYEIIVDILSTVGLVLMFAGTFAGMVAGLLGGIFISIFLLGCGKLLDVIVKKVQPTFVIAY